MSETTQHLAEAAGEYLTGLSRARLLEEISQHESVEPANALLHRLTGIRGFFPDRAAYEEFRRALRMPFSSATEPMEREWGDFQTPPKLAWQVCSYLAGIGVSPQVIIEPTCGAGSFVLAALNAFPRADLIYAVEIQDKYEWHLKIALLTEALRGRRIAAEVELHRDDIFTHRFPEHVLNAQDILILGNPPWVTSAELGVLDARNLPAKSNLKAFNGLDAKTGKSNFDLGEFIVLRLLELFSGRRGTLAMLCKNSVIKNVVEDLPRRQFKVANIRALGIDAKREFGASVDASLLVMDLGASRPSSSCQVAKLDNPLRVTRTFGWTRSRFVSDIADYERFSELEGESPLVWRQGLKHDCASIMELDECNGTLLNGNGEIVDVEDRWVYSLLKSSDLRNFEVSRVKRKVVVTQRHLGENTSILRTEAPRLWEYLIKNSKYFERRRSSIYRGRPRFSMFGVGDYSFKPFKVAIAGLYKRPFFSVVLPIDDRPVLLDDTCYFLGFDTYQEALFTASILHHSTVQRFLQSIAFADAKRPYTKEILMRIDVGRAADQLSFRTLQELWAELGYNPRVSGLEADFEAYKHRLLEHGNQGSLQLSLGI